MTKNQSCGVFTSTMEPFSRRKLFCSACVLLVTFACGSCGPLAQDDHQSINEDNFPLLEEELVKPPRNLSVEVQSGSQAVFTWDPPEDGQYDKFELRISQLPNSNANHDEQRDLQQPQQDQQQQPKVFSVEDRSVSLSSIFEPGNSYQAQVVSVFKGDTSEPITTNFTTKPNSPERFVVWFRNETALLIYWQPPSGTYDFYKVNIDPADSPLSSILVSRQEYQNGRVQPGFYGLRSGREYNISVITISQGQPSDPLVRTYRTLPHAPESVSVSMSESNLNDEDQSDSRPNGFLVEWVAPPQDTGEYDGFQVYLNRKGMNKPMQKYVPRGETSVLLEDSGLEEGMTYQVVVKTVSGKTYSRPASQNVTLVFE